MIDVKTLQRLTRLGKTTTIFVSYAQFQNTLKLVEKDSRIFKLVLENQDVIIRAMPDNTCIIIREQ